MFTLFDIEKNNKKMQRADVNVQSLDVTFCSWNIFVKSVGALTWLIGSAIQPKIFVSAFILIFFTKS